jgi:Uma2 family endonuclease
MVEPVISVPAGGWTTDDLDALPETNQRYELTDGAITVSPSASGLHQAFAGLLLAVLNYRAPDDVAVTGAVEVRFSRQLTRIPDLVLVSSEHPGRHWFAPAEVLVAVEIESPGSHVEDRTTKPALYAQHGIPHYWRVELHPLQVTVYELGEGDAYREVGRAERLRVAEPFPVDVELAELLPRWAR